MDILYATLPNGEQIPRIGFGTWGIGGSNRPDYARDANDLRAIQAAIRLGFTHIDTAEGYARGHSEELVGRALQDFKREDIFLATKVSPYDSHLGYKQVLAALPRSLKRLGVDYVDLYMIHWPEAAVPLEETFKALNELAAQGVVRHLGVSNFDLDLLKRACDLSDPPLLANQVPYSLFHREYAHNGVLDYCQRNNVLLVAYTPIEVGKVFDNQVVREVAQAHNATPVQVALNWVIRQPAVVTIPKSASEAHLRENKGAYDLRLTAEDVARLDALA